jgi:CheY-like chemotaxis protein
LREGISLRIRCDSRIPVTADRTQMLQVLANLVVNARDALPKGGDIRIRIAASEVDRRRAIELGVERCGRFAMVSVEDNGTGMDEETRARLFEPFFTTKAKGMGTGLGLATVYGIIGQHLGAIQVESALGRGTTFTLWLPSTDASETVSIDPVMPVCLRGGDETLLVVDDDIVVRELMVRLLGRVGYRIIEAKSGEHALEIARAHQGPIHLMVCDVIMPGMRGPELWEHLRKQRPETRVLFVSGFASDSIEAKDDLKLLAKPFTRAEILGRIRVLLDEQT